MVMAARMDAEAPLGISESESFGGPTIQDVRSPKFTAETRY